MAKPKFVLDTEAKTVQDSTIFLTRPEGALVRMVFEEYNALISQASKHRDSRLQVLVDTYGLTGAVMFDEKDGVVTMKQG